MRTLQRCLVVALVALFATGSVFAQKKARKLPESAYIKTAKIEISYGKPENYQTAVAMLDSLLINYGPHAEAYYWKSKVMIDLAGQTPGFNDKKPYIHNLVLYIDSLKQTCANEQIKKDYRKDCSKQIKELDTLRVALWKGLYNAGVEKLQQMDTLNQQMETTTDSASLQFLKDRMPMLVDSCLQSMTLAIMVDSSDSRTYVGLGTAYKNLNKFDSSNYWLNLGIGKAQDKLPLLSQIAYNYVQMNDYCGAIPYFKDIIALSPKDTSAVPTMFNLAICYNNCKHYDSALVVQREILTIDPASGDALTGIGRYFNTQARLANDSVNAASERKDEAARKTWSAARDNAFDSSKTYFGKVFQVKSDAFNSAPDQQTKHDSTDLQFAAEEFALVSALRGDYKSAAEAFKRSTELDPTIVENWTSLGDCYISLKQFKDAIFAYEKVVELEPNNKDIWQRLSDLYKETGQPAKQAEADKKLKEI